MSGIYYLASLIAVVLLLRWYIRADAPGEERLKEGLFGMRDHLERKAPFKTNDEETRRR